MRLRRDPAHSWLRKILWLTGIMTAIFLVGSDLVFAETVMASCSGKYTCELEKKHESVVGIKEDAGMIEDGFKRMLGIAQKNELATAKELTLTNKDLIEIVPPATKIQMQLQPMLPTSTLSPEVKTSIVRPEKEKSQGTQE